MSTVATITITMTNRTSIRTITRIRKVLKYRGRMHPRHMNTRTLTAAG